MGNFNEQPWGVSASGVTRPSPTAHELARHLGVDVDHVLEALSVSHRRTVRSLDAPATDGDGDELSLGEVALPSIDAGFERSEAALIVADLLRDLDDRDRKIVHLRFYESRSQEEIAAELGVSQSYLSRLLKRVLTELRERLEHGLDITGPSP